MVVPQPVYVNMHDLNRMVSSKRRQNSAESNALPSPPVEITPGNASNTENSSRSQGSLASSGYGSQSQIVVHEECTYAEETGWKK